MFTFTSSGTVTTVASLGPYPEPETPVGALVKAPDGRFYGTTESGMPGFLGGVFSFDPASGDVAVAHDFNTNPGLGLITSAGLLRAADGTLLGTSHGGGAHSVGTVFRVDTTAPFPDVTKVADVPPLGPAHPSERMVRASDGHLYGTTSSGGAYGSGTIFRFANGVMTPIHDFDFVNGHLPSGELVQASDGYLYGTTTYGGNIQFTGDIGGGIVFRISLTGAFSVVHAFSNYSVEGAHPLAGLVEGPDGHFYGTTHQAGPLGAGTVFKMTPSGVVTTLHAFSVWSATRGTLVLGEDGYFYGVTREGGSNPNGGTIYKIDSQGNFVLLHEFVNPDDGAHPTALTLGTDGNLYGVTEHGGVLHHGTLFRITPAGALTVLHRFDQTVDGEAPASAPVEAGDGRFYGTTWLSGMLGGFFSGLGTIYRYDSGGFSLLHTFGIPLAAADGTPFAGLTQGSNDRLFGATLIQGGGTLYSFEAGITNKAPVVQHQRVSIGPGGAANVTIPAVDPDGNAISFSIVGQPAHGTVTGSGPSFQYQPSSGFSGTDSFYVRVNDGTVSSAVAGVAITVGAPNAAPVAHDQSVSLSEDTALAITLTGSDPEGGALSFSLLTSPANGILTGTAPNLTFQATGHYHGSDSFTFKVTDNGSLDSNGATVSITIDSVNDAPVAFDQSFTSTNGAPVPLVLSANDADGDALSYNIIAPPAGGVLSGGGTNLTYTPNPGFAGADTFTWHANDGTADSNVATVTVTVPATIIATVTTLQLSPAAVGALQPVTLTATVTPAAGGGVPSGDVEFVIGATEFGVAPLQGGVAVLNTNASANGGTFAIAARYVGALPFTGSVSASATLTVRPLAESTYTFLFPWTNARVLGTPFTASAFVVPLSGGTAPAGTVEFFEGTSLVATATLSSGVATATWTPSATGTLAISARYLGSGTLAPSASHPALIAVYAGPAPASTTTTLAAGPSPATFGQPVTFTATVSASVPAGGLVTFFADGVVLGSAAVTNVGGVKRATLTTSALALGLKIVSASYAGAPGFAPSNAALISVTINP